MSEKQRPPARHRTSGVRGNRRAPRRGIAATVVAALLATALPFVFADRASASPTVVLTVTSTAWGGADATPGDGVCATSAGTCTLRAAIQESNALDRGPDEVLIEVSSSIATGTTMTGTANLSSNSMLTSSVSQQDTGAYFAVTAPVVIDLGHRLQVNGSANESIEHAAFYLNGPDISVLNADMVLSGGSSFVVGPLAQRVTIDGSTTGGYGQVSTSANYYPERFVVFREGATDVTVTRYQVSGYYDDTSTGGVFVFNTRSPYTAMQHIVVDDVQILYLAGTTCGSQDGSGCRTRLTNFWGSNSLGVYQNVTVQGLTFRNMVVQNMTGQYAFQLGNPTSSAASSNPAISDLVIEDNVFTNNRGYGSSVDGNNAYAFVTLPRGGGLTGTSSIARNVFSRATSGQVAAVYYQGAQTSGSTTPSGLTIADNHFDGYTGGATIRIRDSGTVTVTGNTFGTGTGSQSTTVSEEYSDGPSVLVNTYHGSSTQTYQSSNRSIRTWAPTAASEVVAGTVPASATRLTSALPDDVPRCTATVPVAAVTATDNNSTAAESPVTLQAYWTSGRTAEVYLGEVTGVAGSSATLAYDLPVTAVTLPGGATASPVDATGSATGYVRLQTHVEGLGQLESSQYSRVVAVSGTCRPVLTIDQASGQNDPTLGRDLHLTLTSSIALDPSTVTTSDITLAVTPVATTVDAGRIDARVVSVTEVAGSGGLVFDVVVRADDSAQIEARVAAGVVATTAGLTNADPAGSTDPQITYQNPLVVTPATFTLVTGTSRDVVLGLRPGAPVPAADLVFAATVTDVPDVPAVTLSTTSAVLAAGGTTAAPITVTADAGDVTANTAVPVTFTLSSTDLAYDGLVVPPATPRLFATDPTLTITKKAYVEVGDASGPAQIQATGTEVASGSRLVDGQAICFVYTVTNVSADDWATSLSDVVVTDSDARLGAQGTIGTVATLGVGQQAQLSACTSLVAVDTTTSGGAGG